MSGNLPDGVNVRQTAGNFKSELLRAGPTQVSVSCIGTKNELYSLSRWLDVPAPPRFRGALAFGPRLSNAAVQQKSRPTDAGLSLRRRFRRRANLDPTFTGRRIHARMPALADEIEAFIV